jgi:hypothetical protein
MLKKMHIIIEKASNYIDSQSEKRNGAVRMEDSSIPTVHILRWSKGRILDDSQSITPIKPFVRTIGIEERSVTPFVRAIGMEEWSLTEHPPTDRRNGGMVGYSVHMNSMNGGMVLN